MTDFSQISHEETVQHEATGGGSFNVPQLAEGNALVRLREVIEMGERINNYDKRVKPMRLVFEVVHAKENTHQVTKNDGEFVRNQEITVRVNKGFNEKGKYRPLFNKLNYNGAVPNVKGEVPSMHHFLGRPYLVKITNNTDANGKVWANLDDADGVWQVNPPVIVQTDDMGSPTGEVKDITVPEMVGDQVCFLWGSNVSDDMLKAMWDSLDRGTYTDKDGNEQSRSFERMDIMNPEENLSWEGSREQALLVPDGVDDMLAGTGSEGNAESGEDSSPAAVDNSDPLAGL